MHYEGINDTMRISYYLKLCLGGAGLLSSAVFIATTRSNTKRDTAAVAEWITAAIFILYMLSFVFEMLEFPRPENEVPHYE